MSPLLVVVGVKSFAVSLWSVAFARGFSYAMLNLRLDVCFMYCLYISACSFLNDVVSKRFDNTEVQRQINLPASISSVSCESISALILLLLQVLPILATLQFSFPFLLLITFRYPPLILLFSGRAVALAVITV